MKPIFYRTVLVLALLPVLLTAFFWTLMIETARAFRYAWLEVRINAGDFLRLWREAGAQTGRFQDPEREGRRDG